MKILLVGGGGREHALAWAIAASPECSGLIVAPGNAGIAQIADCFPVAAEDVEGQVALAVAEAVDFVVVGPEAPLVAGLVDRLEAAGILAFGPQAAAAMIEGSKGFMKDLCARAGVPTAAYGRFQAPEPAKDFVREKGAPIVVKADGLAAGKGVVIAGTLAEAEAAIEDAFAGAFGAAGAELVIEEFLPGEEASLFALSDGERALFLGGAQDHKRAHDGDTGPNTGGMGAYSPAPVLTPGIEQQAMAQIVQPLIDALAARGTPYKGVFYAGLMIENGAAKLLEVNCRFGDPETQALMMRLRSDVLALLHATARGRLDTVSPRFDPRPAITVVMAAKGYPGAYDKDTVIRIPPGLENADRMIFHAGTRRGEDGRLRAAGGRVLNITATGATLADARTKAYDAIARIDWPDGFCRRDIAARAAY